MPFQFKEMIDILKNTFKNNVPVVTKISKKENRNPYLVLVGTLLSLRTKDELTEKVMDKLTKEIRTPEEMLSFPIERLRELIYPVGFYKNKSAVLKNVSRIIIDVYEGKVPDSIDELLKIKGIGRKTANLVITEGYNKLGICVDTHVHRISNRIGIVMTKNPHQTEEVLRKVLPKKYWIIYNTLLVTFGKNICKPISPHCSICPISHLCNKSGVLKYR
ncbi:MAG: endonuclease III [Proteobacteria bacterium]|nr:endonuclease III [Pseudomonadota bacterium]